MCYLTTCTRTFQGQLKIATLNVRGLGDKTKRRVVFESIRRQTADIVLLQETHLTSSTNDLVESEWGGKWINSFGETNSRGMSIIVNPKLNATVMSTSHDSKGRYIIVKMKVEKSIILCINVYGPNTDDADFFLNLIADIETETEYDMIVLGGDFNFVFDNAKDRRYPSKNHEKSCEIFESYFDKTGLIDAWRTLHPDDIKFSWNRNRTQNNSSVSRIDYIFVSQGWANNMVESEIIPCRKTDHSFVTVSLKLDQIQRGSGTWKFNNRLLCDDEFVTTLNEKIEACSIYSTIMNPNNYWCYLKNEITQTCKVYAREKAFNTRQYEADLTKLMLLLEEELNTCQSEETKKCICSETSKIESKLDTLAVERAQSTIFRSKARWVRDGEKNSKYFFSLEKRRYLEKNMTTVVTEDNEVITDPDQTGLILFKTIHIKLQCQIRTYTPSGGSMYRL